MATTWVEIVLWTLLLPATFVLVRNLLVLRRHRREGTPLPWYYAGNMAGALALFLLITAQLFIERRPFYIAALIGAMFFLALDVVMQVRAQRRQLDRSDS